MESVHVVLLDRRFRNLWWNAKPQDNPFIGKSLLEFTMDETRLREKFAALMLDGPVEEFVMEWMLYQPPDYTGYRIAKMLTKLIRVDDLPTVAFVAIGKEVADLPQLAEQDREILRLLGDDLTLVEIADKMGRSLSTIEYRSKRLKEAFGVKTLPGLAAEAVRREAIRRKENKQARPAVRRRA